MTAQVQTKRYRDIEEPSNKVRQLSGLFSIISSNLLLATEVLNTEYKIKTVSELEMLSRKARILAKDLSSTTSNISQDELDEKISLLKNKLLLLIDDLNQEICSRDSMRKSSQKTMEDIILAKRLLRESQRGLVTIQD